MSKNTSEAAIKHVISSTITCSENTGCINLLLIVRRLFFSLPSRDHIEFIDIAEAKFGIQFDNGSCTAAMQKCTHATDFDAKLDVAFSPE